jgi:outer membrane protein
MAKSNSRATVWLLGLTWWALLAGRSHAAQTQPLWEFGLGIGALAFNDYRGADSSHLYVLPVPYFIYRGKLLQADRDGLHSIFLDLPRIDFNFSIYATTPVRNDSARAGMPNLQPTLELGPAFDVHLWRSGSERVKFDFRLPLRAAVAVAAPPRFIGYILAPQFDLDIVDVAGLAGWNLGLLAGPLFADRRYDEYFYAVAPQYATPTRPSYEAHGGYAGTQMIAALSKRYPNFWVGAFVRHDSLAGASFMDSPLVERDSYWSAGIGIAWMIRESERTVDATE